MVPVPSVPAFIVLTGRRDWSSAGPGKLAPVPPVPAFFVCPRIFPVFSFWGALQRVCPQIYPSTDHFD
jgi:hypothetical protein